MLLTSVDMMDGGNFCQFKETKIKCKLSVTKKKAPMLSQHYELQRNLNYFKSHNCDFYLTTSHVYLLIMTGNRCFFFNQGLVFINTPSNLNADISGPHVGLYELAANHLLDLTHTMRNSCLTIITKPVKHFHPELTSATINNTANPANQQRIKETLPTLPSNSERGVCSRVWIVMFVMTLSCYV